MDAGRPQAEQEAASRAGESSGQATTYQHQSSHKVSQSQAAAARHARAKRRGPNSAITRVAIHVAGDAIESSVWSRLNASAGSTVARATLAEVCSLEQLQAWRSGMQRRFLRMYCCAMNTTILVYIDTSAQVHDTRAYARTHSRWNAAPVSLTEAVCATAVRHHPAVRSARIYRRIALRRPPFSTCLHSDLPLGCHSQYLRRRRPRQRPRPSPSH